MADIGLPTLTAQFSTVTATTFTGVESTARSILKQRDLVDHRIPLNEWREDDDFDSFLPAAATADYLGLTQGTYGSTAPTIVSTDAESGNITAASARVLFKVPHNYVAGESIVFRVRCKMSADAASTSSVLTVSAELHDADGGTTALTITAGQNVNSTSLANYDYTITPTGVAAGSILDILMALTVVDDQGAGSGVVFTVTDTIMRIDIK